MIVPAKTIGLASLAALLCWTSASAKNVDFNRQIRPILSEHCFQCHGPDKKARKGDFRLDRPGPELHKKGIVVPKNLQKSSLVARISSADEDLRMPPKSTNRPLSKEKIALLKEWIASGGKFKSHWSLIPPRRPALPTVNSSWPRNSIDTFVLSKLKERGLTPTAEADKTTLIRRLTLDLTGLPPKVDEVRRFLADRSPAAYEKLVGRLLDSPRFGEHMAWTWLDAARYGDTNGYQGDRTRTMWFWRDWVVRSLNHNLSFKDFTIEQLAGDLLPRPTRDQLIATGFNRNHPLNGEGGRIAEENRVEYVFDRVETTATVWMGLTLGCARCHDHKYDALTQREYYNFYAFFNDVDESGRVDRGGNANPVVRVPNRQQRFELSQLKDLLAVQTARQSSQDKKIQSAAKKEIARLRGLIANVEKKMPQTMVMRDRGKSRTTYVLNIGRYDKPDRSRVMKTGVPASLPPLANASSKPRLRMAQWLVDGEHPLTSRVAVNRQWQILFGRGLVETSEDFGSQGKLPSHPGLLDWLSVEFSQTGWNVKRLVRLIVTSATYRQSSRTSSQALRLDPSNRLLSRSPRYRLPAQTIRDQALAVSGLLDKELGGPSVKPYQPPGLWADFSFGKIRYKQDKGSRLYRRSLYTFWRRSFGPPNMFDAANRQVCNVRPRRTNTPLHALTLLNDKTFVEAARVFAQRMLKSKRSDRDRLIRAFEITTARRPSTSEMTLIHRALQNAKDHFAKRPKLASQLVSVGDFPRDSSIAVPELAAWTSLLNMILNLDEVITRE